MRGEQSNTSIICQDGRRRRWPRRSRSSSRCSARCTPATTPTSSSSPRSPRRGPTAVPHTVGYVAGEWADPQSGERARTATWPSPSEFLPGVEDAWRVALGRRPPEQDFSEAAPEPRRRDGPDPSRPRLGAGHRARGGRRQARARPRSIRSRYDAAVAEVPALVAPTRTSSPRRSTTVAARELARPAARPRRLPPRPGPHAPGTAGSRSTSRASRCGRSPSGSRPDLALRDVAGMLRSFDYVGGSVGLERPDRSARDWVAATRTAPSSRATPVADPPRSRRGRCSCSGPSSSTRPSTRSSTRPATGRLWGSRPPPSSGSSPTRAPTPPSTRTPSPGRCP